MLSKTLEPSTRHQLVTRHARQATIVLDLDFTWELLGTLQLRILSRFYFFNFHCISSDFSDFPDMIVNTICCLYFNEPLYYITCVHIQDNIIKMIIVNYYYNEMSITPDVI